MTVNNGQPVDQAVTNAAFMSRLSDTSAVGKVTLNNTTDATDLATAALKLLGGMIVEKKLNVGGDFKTFAALFEAELTDSSTTGSLATLTTTGSFVTLTNSSLVSLAGISGFAPGRAVTILNLTGSSFTVLHNQGSPSATGIHTGTTEDVVLDPGASLKFLYSGEDDLWHAVGGTGGKKAEYIQEVPTGAVDGVNDTFTLSEIPISSESLLIEVNGVVQVQGTHYTVVDDVVTFQAGAIPATESVVYAYYVITDGVFGGGGGGGLSPIVEYRTITGGEETAKQLTLGSAPDTAAYTIVDVIGSGAAHYGVDFSVTGATLSWAGLSFDGQLVAGDVLRVHYFI